MPRTWLEPHHTPIPERFHQSIGGHSLVSQLLLDRGISDVDSAKGFLSPEFFIPTSGLELPELGKVVDIVIDSINTHKKIGVWGDFDVDGQTATTILVSAIRELGGNVLYHIPIRAEESHGISIKALEQFLEKGVEVLLTCDTGISSHAAIEFARENSSTVLVTDHHELPEVLPSAHAMVNPRFLPDRHPLSSLPGVGVVYKLIEQLFLQAGEKHRSESYLDLVALGIVADVVLLKGDTRYLLQLGLQTLRATRRLGLVTIFELAELNQANLTEEHIAYFLAPRLNAIGRLHDANPIVELLTTTDQGRARILALELEGMNAQRKLLTEQVFQAAEGQLEKDPKLLEYPVLVLSHPSWPAGVVGIVASRLVEKYHRPVILLSSPIGQDARGSARSVEGVNITSVIAANRHLVKSFGGHPMAAGLSIDQTQIQDFRQAISHTIGAMGVPIDKEKELQINAYLTLPELSLSLVDDFERLAPFGAGNPPLVLATRNLKLAGYAVVGRNDEHLQLTLEDELGHTHNSIWWQGAGNSLPEGLFDLAYTVRASSYRGQREIQIEWVDYRVDEKYPVVSPSKIQTIEVIDYRKDPDPMQKLLQLQEHEQLLIWGEAEIKSKITCFDRTSLHAADVLAILTIPPGLKELKDGLQSITPRRVYLFGIDPGMDDMHAFVNRLLGLLKYRIRTSHGNVSLLSLAAATAQKVSTISLGLDWLQAHGYIELITKGRDKVQLKAGGNMLSPDAQEISTRLASALNESAAFRRYYLRADKERLILQDE